MITRVLLTLFIFTRVQSQDCTDVNHITDNPGYYTCNCVEDSDDCVTAGLCPSTEFCPAKDGQAVLPEEQECFEDPTPSIDVLISEPVRNNLDNWQDLSGQDLIDTPPTIYYENVGFFDGDQVDMVVQIADDCETPEEDLDDGEGACVWIYGNGKEESVFNGDGAGGFGKINVARSKVDLDLLFVRPNGDPIVLDHLYITFMDVDGTNENQEAIVFFDVSHLEVTDDTRLTVERLDAGEDDFETWKITNIVPDNPSDGNVNNPQPQGGAGGIHQLYDDQMQVAAMARWDNTNKATVRLLSAEGTRNFLFAGVSFSFLRRCLSCEEAWNDLAYNIACPGGDTEYLQYPTFLCDNGEADLCEYEGEDGESLTVCNCVSKLEVGGSYITEVVTDVTSRDLVIENAGVQVTLTGGMDSFTFGPILEPGDIYNVSIVTEPEYQICSITNPAGTAVDADIDNIQIVCTLFLKVGGAYSTVVSAGVTDGNVEILFSTAYHTIPITLTGGVDTYDFGNLLRPNEPYAVSITTEPTLQYCTIENESGDVDDADINDINIVCTLLHSVGGTYSTEVSASDPGGALVISFGDEIRTLPGTDGVPTSFDFGPMFLPNDPYEVTIVTQPALQKCTITNEQGNVVDSDITDVTIECTMLHSVGGTYSTEVSDGESDGELVIAFGDEIRTLPGTDGVATAFDFGPMLLPGDPYEVTIVTEPTLQTCTISNEQGNIVDSDITDVTIVCTMLISVGGSYSTVVSPGVTTGDFEIAFGDNTLSLSGGDEQPFDFGPMLHSGDPYAVTIVTQPDLQYCTITNEAGNVVDEYITDIRIDCVMIISLGGSYTTIDGTASGLTGSFDLEIEFGEQALTLPAQTDADFDFGPLLYPGDAYEVVIKTEPDYQYCTIINEQGTAEDTDITDVRVDCRLLYSLSGTYTTGVDPDADETLVIQFNDGVDTHTLNLPTSEDGTFDFGPLLYPGDSYTVEIVSGPGSQFCTITNKEGTASQDITDVEIVCSADPYMIIGHVLGLPEGKTITLTENGRDYEVSPGWFTWPVNVGPGYLYSFTVTDNPSKLTCTVHNGDGSVAESNVDNVFVICTPIDCPNKDVDPTIMVDLENAQAQHKSLGGMGDPDDPHEILFPNVGQMYDGKEVDLHITVSENCEYCDYVCSHCANVHNGGFAKINFDATIDLTFSFTYAEDGRPATMGVVYMSWMDLDGRQPMTEGIEFMDGVNNLRYHSKTKLQITDYRDIDGKMTAYIRGWQFNTFNPKRLAELSKEHKKVMVMSKHIGVSQFDVRFALGDHVNHGRNMLFGGAYPAFMRNCQTCGKADVCPGGKISPSADLICDNADTLDDCRPKSCQCNKCQDRCEESYTSWYTRCTWWGCGGCEMCSRLEPENSAECQDYCQTRADDAYGWPDACQLEECRGCSGCADVEPCARWCMEIDLDTPWETKCSYDTCSGCSQCVSS